MTVWPKIPKGTTWPEFVSAMEKKMRAAGLDPRRTVLTERRHSDNGYMPMDKWEIKEMLDEQQGDFLIDMHPTMSPGDKLKAKKFLHYEGN